MGIDNVMVPGFSRILLLACAPSALGLSGCGPASSGDGAAEAVAQVTSALDFQDASGLVRIRVKTCSAVSSHLEPITGKNVAESICPVDDGWVMVGGGAEIVGEGQPGALIRASKPNPFPFGNGTQDFTSWVGRSADNRMANNTQAFPHQLVTYVIGLQLEGMDATTLTGNLIAGQDFVTSMNVANPTVTSTITNTDFVVIGGGGEVLPTTLQQPEPLFPTLYLTESRADAANGWRITARNNQTGEVGGVKSYATAIRRCPTGWHGKCLSFNTFQNTGAASAAYGVANATVASPWVMTAIGGFAQQGGTGRYLADLIPANGTQQGVTARSKNLGGAGTGTTTAVAMAIQGPQPATITVGTGCSFEQAVATVNTQQRVGSCATPTSNDTIRLPAGTTVAAGINLDIHHSVTIAGAGVSTSTLQFSGGSLTGDAGLQVSGGPDVFVTFQDVTLRGTDGNQLSAVRNLDTTSTFTNVRLTNFGFAAIHNVSSEGHIAINGSTIDHNGVFGSLPLGGGVLNFGFVVAENSNFRDNFAFQGGAIASFLRVELRHSSVQNNQAIFSGGGIHCEGFAVIENSTFTGNGTGDGETGAGGGAVYFNAPGAEYLQALGNTFAFNDTAGQGGGLYFINGSPDIGGNIFAFNTAEGAGPDVSIDVASNSLPFTSNLVTNAAGITQAGVQVACVPSCPNPQQCNNVICANPLLGSLTTTANGTASYSLLANSPAIDTAGCGRLFDDQRGTARPQGNSCDIGSVEFIPVAPLFGFETAGAWQSTAPLTLTTARKTQGQFGLSVGGSNYRLVTSTPFTTPPPSNGPTMRVDFFLPGNQPNPFYFGAVQAFADCPSANVNNVYIGQVELTGKPTNAFSTLAFPLPTAVRNAFNQVHNDCTLAFGVNTNATPVSPVLDNLRFGP